jgi:hypothetical protein
MRIMQILLSLKSLTFFRTVAAAPSLARYFLREEGKAAAGSVNCLFLPKPLFRGAAPQHIRLYN